MKDRGCVADGQIDVFSDAVSKTCTGAQLVWERAVYRRHTHTDKHPHTHTHASALLFLLLFIPHKGITFINFISVPSHSYSSSVLPSPFLPFMSPAGCPCHVLLPYSGLPTPLSRSVPTNTSATIFPPSACSTAVQW